jgi:hypothetical protein
MITAQHLPRAGQLVHLANLDGLAAAGV